MCMPSSGVQRNFAAVPANSFMAKRGFANNPKIAAALEEQQKKAAPKPAPKPAPAPAPAPVLPADPVADGPIVGDSDPVMGGRQDRRRRQTGIFSNIRTSSTGDPLFGGNTVQRATFGGR